MESDAHSEDSMNTMDLYELFENEQVENSQKGKTEEVRVKTPNAEDLKDFIEMENRDIKIFIEYCISENRNICELMRSWLKNLSNIRFMTWPKSLNEIFVNVYLKHRLVNFYLLH